MPARMGGNDVAQRLHRAREKPRKLPCRRKVGWGERLVHEQDMNPIKARFKLKIGRTGGLARIALGRCPSYPPGGEVSAVVPDGQA
jgi:hypothetical protein